MIDKLSQYASVRGLANDTLGALVGILATTPCYLDQSAIRNVVKILFPRGKVSEDVVVKIVGCFGKGQRKASPETQVRPRSTFRISSRRLTTKGSFTPLADHGVRHT